MTIQNFFAYAFVLIAPLVSVAAETGDLKIRFEYGGDAPKLGDVKVTADVAFCGKQGLIDQSLIVDGETKGIKNVVQLYTGREDQIDPLPNAKSLTTMLAGLNRMW